MTSVKRFVPVSKTSHDCVLEWISTKTKEGPILSRIFLSFYGSLFLDSVFI